MSWLESGTSGDSLAVCCLLAVRTQVALELERGSLLDRFHVRSRRRRVLQHNINDFRNRSNSRLVGCPMKRRRVVPVRLCSRALGSGRTATRASVRSARPPSQSGRRTQDTTASRPAAASGASRRDAAGRPSRRSCCTSAKAKRFIKRISGCRQALVLVSVLHGSAPCLSVRWSRTDTRRRAPATRLHPSAHDRTHCICGTARSRSRRPAWRFRRTRCTGSAAEQGSASWRAASAEDGRDRCASRWCTWQHCGVTSATLRSRSTGASDSCPHSMEERVWRAVSAAPR